MPETETTPAAATPPSGTSSTETTTTSTPTPETGKPEGTLLGGGASASQTTEPAPEEFAPYTADTLKEIIGDEKAELDNELANEFLDVVNIGKLPRTEVERLMGLQNKILERVNAAHTDAWTKIRNDWTSEVKNAFPGAKLDAEQTRIGQLLDEFGDQALREHLNLTGAGDSPALFRFLSKIADRLVKEGQPASGKATSTERSIAEKLYPTMQREGA